MKMPIVVALLAALLALPAVADPAAIALEVEALGAARELWPGYQPLAIPLAIYDGARTWLYRHPSPPTEFAPVAGARPAAHAFWGRHPAVAANSSAEIGGIATATLLADGARARQPARELAAVALHEAFHVFQRQRHPGWSGNEADLFLYPVDDASLLGQRRLETAALARALATAKPTEAACWARLALRHREARFAAMDPAFQAYERLTELNEGLATYVQLVATGRTSVEIPAAEFPAAAVRERSYAVGPAWAFLLDRFAPGWKSRLEADDKLFLDLMLDQEIAKEGGSCAWAPAERAALEEQARFEAGFVVADRIATRESLEKRQGWRVVVQAAPGQPLWPQGFDPLNVHRLDQGLRHGRFLAIGNDALELRMLDEDGVDLTAWTLAAGRHPLFEGVATATIFLNHEPRIERSAATTVLRAPGFELTVRDPAFGVAVVGQRVAVGPAPGGEGRVPR